MLLFARQWLPATADAEDALQEAFIKFWRKYQNPDDRHAGLLFATVRHVALDHIRRETRRKRRENLAADDPLFPRDFAEETAPYPPAASQDTAVLETALRQLPADQREVLVLKIWGELTFAQIGQALDLSANTAASRYRYAIAALKKIIRPVCYE